MYSDDIKAKIKNNPDLAATLLANCHHRVTYKNGLDMDKMNHVNASLVRSAVRAVEGAPLPVKASPSVVKRNQK
ncbi:hypothetical protein [Photorhabdus sp. SF281]|uniref:hypothetical protein n=1 Tax=Photorhabdus sp. SF281 TaxID=3459527 RepID=UPI004044DD78